MKRPTLTLTLKDGTEIHAYGPVVTVRPDGCSGLGTERIESSAFHRNCLIVYPWPCCPCTELA